MTSSQIPLHCLSLPYLSSTLPRILHSDRQISRVNTCRRLFQCRRMHTLLFRPHSFHATISPRGHVGPKFTISADSGQELLSVCITTFGDSTFRVRKLF